MNKNTQEQFNKLQERLNGDQEVFDVNDPDWETILEMVNGRLDKVETVKVDG